MSSFVLCGVKTVVRVTQNVIVALVLIVLISGVGKASVFVDPTSSYSVKIPNNWVYQAYESDRLLTVFYGEGNPNLLYFEQFIQIPDDTALNFAERTLDLYAGAGGLKEFLFNGDFKHIEVHGQPGVLCVYTYKGNSGKDLWEERIFFRFSEKHAFSITFGGEGKWEERDEDVLKDVLTDWRWLF